MQLGHPKAAILVDKVLTEIFKLMGDEYEQYGDALLGPGPLQNEGGTPPGESGAQVSNQNQVPVSVAEQTTRAAING